MFGVYHPRKKDKFRGVFDSSAEFMGHSLNKVLLKGPDLTNDLVGGVDEVSARTGCSLRGH